MENKRSKFPESGAPYNRKQQNISQLFLYRALLMPLFQSLPFGVAFIYCCWWQRRRRLVSSLLVWLTHIQTASSFLFGSILYRLDCSHVYRVNFFFMQFCIWTKQLKRMHLFQSSSNCGLIYIDIDG